MINRDELKVLFLIASGEIDNVSSESIERGYGIEAVYCLVALDKKGFVKLLPYGDYLWVRGLTLNGKLLALECINYDV